MEYKPKIITGRAQNTGYPIDGHVLTLSQWDYDNHASWHLYGWEPSEDEAVMETMYRAELDAGFRADDTHEEFVETWKAGEYEPPAAFTLELDQVEVLEVLQEEEGAAPAAGIRPRELHDKGGIMCLPLDQNLNGDTQAKHPEWTPISCPRCGRKCWKPAEADRIHEAQGVRFMCTECAIKAGLLAPYKSSSNPNPAGNRAQRRRANREKRRK